MISLTEIPSASSTRRIWLHIGTLLDGVSTSSSKDAHIVYDCERIVFVGTNGHQPPHGSANPGQTKPDVVAPNATLLPSLIEAHAHLFLEGAELDFEKRKRYLEQSPEELLSHGRSRLEKLLKIGIQAYRDAGDKHGVGLALSALYNSSQRPLMPYVDSPGSAIHHRGRYGSFMSEPIEEHPTLSDLVEARVKKGADRIKLIPTGIIDFKKGIVTAKPQMTTEEITELVRVSKLHGRQTFAHASGDQGIDIAINGGVDSIEHGFFIRDDQLSRLRDDNIAWVPTFAPVQLQVDCAECMGWDDTIVSNLKRILERHSHSLSKAAEMGVTIIAGSDAGSCGVAHGYGFLYELELMERAGMTPINIINSATGISARRLKLAEETGTIEVGNRSRFIVTEHSLTKSVANLRKNKSVVFDGRGFDSPETTNFDGL